MDFIWQPTFESLKGPRNASRGLLTHLMYNTYQVPCGIPLANIWTRNRAKGMRESFMASLNLEDTFAESFVKCWTDMANAYPTQNVLVTWGEDFAFFDANNSFGLIDDIMDFLSRRGLKLVYSTVHNFTRAV